METVRYPILFEGRAIMVTVEQEREMECKHMRVHAACFCGQHLSDEEAATLMARQQAQLREVVDRLSAVAAQRQRRWSAWF